MPVNNLVMAMKQRPNPRLLLQFLISTVNPVSQDDGFTTARHLRLRRAVDAKREEYVNNNNVFALQREAQEKEEAEQVRQEQMRKEQEDEKEVSRG